MNEKFTWGEIREPPSIGSQTRAMSSPDDLQRGHFFVGSGLMQDFINPSSNGHLCVTPGARSNEWNEAGNHLHGKFDSMPGKSCLIFLKDPI